MFGISNEPLPPPDDDGGTSTLPMRTLALLSVGARYIFIFEVPFGRFFHCTTRCGPLFDCCTLIVMAGDTAVRGIVA
jgi:hypothetical protein